MKTINIFLLFSIILFSCTQTDSRSRRLPEIAEGYVPIYAKQNDVEEIVMNNVTITANAGKIYAYGNYIFQNEVAKGIHIIDNTNKSNPSKIGFLKIPYNTELAVKGNFLYANNLNDLVVFDLSNTTNPVLVKRLPNVFPTVSQNYPLQQNVYFECADAAKGIVVGWEKKTLSNPKCKR
jgi:hypothetical protein